MWSPRMMIDSLESALVFFFNDTATTEISPLSLHDALPISARRPRCTNMVASPPSSRIMLGTPRSEEHTSELQSPNNLVGRLLLEKKQRHDNIHSPPHCTWCTELAWVDDTHK